MNFLTKVIAGALVLMAIGLPILETWRALVVAASILALVFSVPRPGAWRLAAAAALVVAIMGIKTQLPRADIAEGHNAFLVIRDGEALQKGLPAEVFQSWKAQFDALYPPAPEPFDEVRSPWRTRGAPLNMFAESSDAIWRKAKYTRQVDAIDFRSLGEFRGGFANDGKYNWWSGELRRESMPFYAMYELTPASVGSRLAWKGQVFWERSDGSFEEIVHKAVASRAIEPEDAGKRVYAAFFSTPGLPTTTARELFFRMEPSFTLRAGWWIEAFLSAAGTFGVLWLTVRPRWPAYVRAVAIFSIGYLLMASYLAVSVGKFLGREYPPHGGGDDGLAHDGNGHLMALLAGSGDIGTALMGGEPVYWLTPGTRYFRMVEKLIFGDTNLLYALLVPCVLIVMFYLIRHFLGTRWAWAVTALFCGMPVGNPSFVAYIYNAKLGYGEALGGALFLVGLVLLVRTQPAWGGTDRNLPMVWIAGASLAASMFIRPNFAFAVVFVVAAYAWASLRQRDLGATIALAAGAGLALWMPFHNWHYGGELYMISKAGATVSVPLGIGDYTAAAADGLRGGFDSRAIEVVSFQLKGWLWSPGLLVRPELTPLAWIAHGIKLVALIVTAWVAFRGIVGGFSKDRDLTIVALAAMLAHVPMLIIFSTHFRYAMLGWDLSLVILIVWGVRQQRRMRTARADLSPV